MHSGGTEGVGVDINDVCLVGCDVPGSTRIKHMWRILQVTMRLPDGTPSRMAVYGDGITLGLVKDVDLFLVGDKHLLQGLVRRVKGDI